jgi:hypothetical protein
MRLTGQGRITRLNHRPAAAVAQAHFVSAAGRAILPLRNKTVIIHPDPKENPDV